MSHSGDVPITLPLTGENATYVSRIFYGCVFIPTTGQYTFRVTCQSGLRVIWRWQTLYDNLANSGTQNFSWTDNLIGGRWYPFVMHQANGASAAGTWTFFWTKPGQSDAVIPHNQFSALLFNGLFPIRFTDVSGVIRYFQAFKGWDGRSIGLAFPAHAIFPASVAAGPKWPKALPAGTLVEELAFPTESPGGAVLDWGSGWTRRPGTFWMSLPSKPAATFQAKIRGY